MSVKPRGSTFEVYVKQGDRRWRLSATTQAQGDAMEAEIRAALKAGREPDLEIIKRVSASGKKTLREVIEITKRQRWTDGKWAETASSVADKIMEEIGGEMSIEDFSHDELDKLVEGWQRARNSDATINRKKSVLSAVLTTARKRGWLTRPIDMEKKNEGQGRIRWLDDAEERLLLTTTAHFGYTEEAELWMFLIDTGARISEAHKLFSRDIRCTSETATHVTFWDTKNGTSRTVPLTARLRPIMFRRAKQAKPWVGDYRDARTAWERVRTHLGFAEDADWVIHMLRHTCASRLVQRGVPLAVVKEWMGHKTIQITLRYAHLAPANLDAALEMLEAAAA